MLAWLGSDGGVSGYKLVGLESSQSEFCLKGRDKYRPLLIRDPFILLSRSHHWLV